MNILFDASLPPRLARALRILNAPTHEVVPIRDVLGNDASDRNIQDYLTHKPGLVVVMDLEITEHPHRRLALLEWGCPVCVLSASWLAHKPWDMAWMLIRRWPAMLAKTDGAAPAIYVVPPPGQGSIRKLAE
ncbi:MAG TPA: hypothetical protein PKE26_13580 [Kiritimatiellia bacterium]|nr:hypothetical protein [Kiritimatiellia bacterium]HMP00132.1 hypothetical protein [Kiritimatiellia bacterium]HMP96654.1 hypothetical protein [Kiritimatiellia bacterium]